MNFTAHNIALNNGEHTIGRGTILLENSSMWTSIQRTLDLFFPENSYERSSLRAVDLGCLEGGYSVELAKMGFNTLGIEARQENYKKCMYVKSNLNLSHLSFVQDDARNLHEYGSFDITLCYGLLYHLDKPVDFLNQISLCTSKLLLLHTHFSPVHDLRYNLGPLNSYFLGPLQKRLPFLQTHKNYRLSKIKMNEGYKGRWFPEWGKKETKNEIEKKVWASYNNHKSFWLCKKDLTIALHKSGFNHVFEQFNFTGDTASDNYTDFYNRSMFVALKAKPPLVLFLYCSRVFNLRFILQRLNHC